MDCSPPDSSVCAILQARILEWVSIFFFRGSSWPRDQTGISWVSCTGRRNRYHYVTLEAKWVKQWELSSAVTEYHTCLRSFACPSMWGVTGFSRYMLATLVMKSVRGTSAGAITTVVAAYFHFLSKTCAFQNSCGPTGGRAISDANNWYIMSVLFHIHLSVI